MRTRRVGWLVLIPTAAWSCGELTPPGRLASAELVSMNSASDAGVEIPGGFCFGGAVGPGCRCRSGYDWQATALGLICGDIDECSTNAYECDDDQICRNTEGSFECDPNPERMRCEEMAEACERVCGSYCDCSRAYENCLAN